VVILDQGERTPEGEALLAEFAAAYRCPLPLPTATPANLPLMLTTALSARVPPPLGPTRCMRLLCAWPEALLLLLGAAAGKSTTGALWRLPALPPWKARCAAASLRAPTRRVPDAAAV
jgi:hypothetical protein